MNKLMLFLMMNGETNIINSLNTAKSSVTSIINTAASVISGVTAAVSGIVLLIMCIRCGFKARGGQTDAWDDAKDTLAIVGIIMCFSSAVFAAFF